MELDLDQLLDIKNNHSNENTAASVLKHRAWEGSEYLGLISAPIMN